MNKQTKLRKIPYGETDFIAIRKENSYYVDKTRFIEKIEASSKYLFFIRPRRFGKSLWLSVMECYYDISQKDHFEEIFKGTYIYDNPTEEKNSYLILKFNFSEVKANIDKVEDSFNLTIKLGVLKFIKKYETYLNDKDGKKYEIIENCNDASEILKYLISFIEGRGKIYLLIDEYDNFTNTIISSKGQEQYKAITHGEGFYRHFFNVIKAGTTDIGAAISKIFITGVSPVTLDDVTSGFNIGYNVTSLPAFNEMVGFTEEEVKGIIEYYKKELNEFSEDNLEIIRKWYNNYLFSKHEKQRMYNSDMVLYFISTYMDLKILPEEMLDFNIRTDYMKLRYLIITDLEGKLRINGNFEKLKLILEEGEISSNINTSFPAHKVIDHDNFISLLYYFGLLTIKGQYEGMLLLGIPNEVTRQLYYEYIRESYRDTKIFNIDLYKLSQLFRAMAYRGKWEELFDYLAVEMNSQTALRDYIEGERSIQTFLRAYLNVTNYYITKSEYELNKGFCDILLLPNLLNFPDMGYSYLIEIKYIKLSDYSESKLQEKIQIARKQLEKYKDDTSLQKFTGTTKLIKIVLVFSGIELKYKGQE